MNVLGKKPKRQRHPVAPSSHVALRRTRGIICYHFVSPSGGKRWKKWVSLKVDNGRSSFWYRFFPWFSARRWNWVDWFISRMWCDTPATRLRSGQLLRCVRKHHPRRLHLKLFRRFQVVQRASVPINDLTCLGRSQEKKIYNVEVWHCFSSIAKDFLLRLISLGSRLEKRKFKNMLFFVLLWKRFGHWGRPIYTFLQDPWHNYNSARGNEDRPLRFVFDLWNAWMMTNY